METTSSLCAHTMMVCVINYIYLAAEDLSGSLQLLYSLYTRSESRPLPVIFCKAMRRPVAKVGHPIYYTQVNPKNYGGMFPPTTHKRPWSRFRIQGRMLDTVICN